MRKAQRGKKEAWRVAEFVYFQEKELLKLQQELQVKSYTPGPYCTFHVYDKKKRLISAAPFRDRVVHHALCNVVEPIFERHFIYDSYANRIGKGTHAAVRRCQQFARVNRYVLKCDIEKYFPSIDHQILKGLLSGKIEDESTLWLIGSIIDSSDQQLCALRYFPGDDLFTPLQRRKGLPIGNQTSQFFANVYLDPLDRYVKEELRCHHYIRYVDDFLLFASEKPLLWRLGLEIKLFLDHLRLNIHPDKFHVFPVDQGIPFLGYRIFSDYVRLPMSNISRFRRRIHYLAKAYQAGDIQLDSVKASVHGWLGHAVQANSYHLRRDLFSSIRIGPPKP